MQQVPFIETIIKKCLLWIATWNRNRRKSVEKNIYLTGIYKPLKQEVTFERLQVTGSIPDELNGLFVRNGPNPVTPPNPALYQWFTGTGMVHGVRIRAGQALWYRNRWVRGVETSKALGESPIPGPHTDMDSPNTNVLGYAGNLWALVEAGGNPVRLDEKLNSIAHDPFSGSLTKSFTAHPHVDPSTGELHAICYESHEQKTVWHVVVTKEGLVRREEPISVNNGPMIHDCMLTEHFVIILDLPVTFSMKRLLAGDELPYAWNPKHPARIGLLPKEGTNADIIWCQVSPCFVFHCCNAYQTEDQLVVLDACVHNHMFATRTDGPDATQTQLERWTINPQTGLVARAVLDETPQEFPRINEQYLGKQYRYIYTVPYPKGSIAAGPLPYLIKQDVQQGVTKTHPFKEGDVPGEFVFVPKKLSRNEEDGWLMGYVLNTRQNTTQLVIIDATHFTDQAQAIITIPHQIPLGFHGNWVTL